MTLSSSFWARFAAIVRDVESNVATLKILLTECAADDPPDVSEGEEYLSLKELCERIPYKQQTIRNLIAGGSLRNGEHFNQRKRYGKVVFVWSAMQRWLRERPDNASAVQPFIPNHRARTRKVS